MFGAALQVCLCCASAFTKAFLTHIATQAGAMNSPWILCARIFTGMGTGVFNGSSPYGQPRRVIHKDTRGFFVSFEFTLNYVGLITAYWLEYGVSFIGDGTGSFRWRSPLAFQIV